MPAEAEAIELTPDVVWIDLLSPTEGESATVEEASGLTLPSQAELSEIETSSRLRTDGDVVCLSAPLVSRSQAEAPRTTPVGFVLAPELLVTVRYEPLSAFDSYGRAARGSAPEVFVGLIEAIVDRIADVLEHIAAELDILSHRLFRSRSVGGHDRRTRTQENADLRSILRRLGASGDLTSKIRDSLLALARIVPYVATMRGEELPVGVKTRLDTLRHDLTSLNDYETHILNKIQLLMDATLGLINVEQNDIIKVLTVVNVVGVPPTLVASLYGMNFKYMPELDWS
ncbi:MAG: CorA family divalent cation transporter, partial [Alphaproteobacteria bacterium]